MWQVDYIGHHTAEIFATGPITNRKCTIIDVWFQKFRYFMQCERKPKLVDRQELGFSCRTYIKHEWMYDQVNLHPDPAICWHLMTSITSLFLCSAQTKEVGDRVGTGGDRGAATFSPGIVWLSGWAAWRLNIQGDISAGSSHLLEPAS